jgi:hypothetical protein
MQDSDSLASPPPFSRTQWDYLRMDLHMYEHYIVPLNQRARSCFFTVIYDLKGWPISRDSHYVEGFVG